MELTIRLIQKKHLPSLSVEDIKGFGSALTEIDKKTGMYFEKAQGGMYRDKMAPELFECMLQSGVYGAGQSLWGPALYGLVKEKEAMIVADQMRSFLTENAISGKVAALFRLNPNVAMQCIRDGKLEPACDFVAWLLARPKFVIKDGVVVTRDGRIVCERPGRTLCVAPPYDPKIEKKIRAHFQESYTVSFDNYAISPEHLAFGEMVPCE